MFNFTKTKIEKLTRTGCLTLLMAGTLLAQAGTAQTFKFSDFTFTRATATPTNEFHNKTFYQTQTTNKKGKTVTTDVKGVNAFKQFVQKESSAIDLDTLNARKLDSTKLKLKFDKKINIYFIDEGAGYRNQLKLVTTNGTNKDGLVFYDGSRGSGANELLAGDYVTVGDDLSNSINVQAGTILDFQLKANGYDNPSGDVWHTDKTKNTDKLQHVIAYEYEGFLVLAWEDLCNGGDKDYNDIVFAVDIGQANLDAIPGEPPSNTPPLAQDDTGETKYGAPVAVDVLANDTDPENQALTVTGASSLTGATVSVVNGKVQYTPPSDFNIAGGSDSFSYTIKDAQGATGTATVTINVGAKPIPPTENLSCKDNNGHGNNAPIPITLSTGKTLTVTKFDPSNPGKGDYITRAINDTGVSLTASELTEAKAKLQQLVNDFEKNGGSGGAGCTPPANQAPMALNDTANTPNNTPVTINVLGNDVDPEKQTLTITTVNSTTGANVQIVDGEVKYTPKANSNKREGITDTFTYTIKDPQGLTGTATVTVNVGEQPNQPPKAEDDEVSTPKGTPVTVNVVANDSDPDGDPITLEDVNSPIGASAQVVDGKVIYTPKFSSNQAASESFTYTIKDADGATATGTVKVNVGANEAPIAVNDEKSTDYGAPVTVDVLANDTDPDDQTVTIKSDSVSSATGAKVEVIDGKVMYTPKADFNEAGGTDTFTYIIEDVQGATDSATVTVSVGEKPNGAPIAVDDEAQTPYGTPVTVNVMANDSDPEKDSISIVGATSDTGAAVQVVNGQVVYTPKDGFNTAGDTDIFTYTIKDSKGNESSATVTVEVGEKDPDGDKGTLDEEIVGDEPPISD
ncbi:MAG: Ig-like domain-containing protein [Waterburya sp.]